MKILMFSKGKLLKSALLLLGISFFLILVINTFAIASLPNSKTYMSVGRWYQRLSSDPNSSVIAVMESLKIGREWAVFDLNRGKYWGKAKVTSNNYSNCSVDKGGVLTTKLNYQAKDYELVVLVRPIPKNPARAQIKKIKFSQLPMPIQFDMESSFKYSLNEKERFQFYEIDINLDSYADIIAIDIRPDALMFARFDKEWTQKASWWVSGC